MSRCAWHPRQHEQEVTHDANIAVPSHVAVPQAPVKITVLGSWWAALLLVCTTMMCLASAFTAFILYVRPVLQRAERAALACESAAQEMEKASVELDKAAEVIHVDLPTALNAVERASIEFEELGRNLNMVSGPLRRAAVPAVALTRGTMGTGDSIRRVAQDVTSLTQALTPAMEGWRKRISRIASSFEAVNKDAAAAQQQQQQQRRLQQAQAAAASSGGGSSGSAQPDDSQQAREAGSGGKASSSEAVSSPHSVWTSFTEAATGGGARSSGGAGVSAASSRAAAATAAESTAEMADAAHGVISEASRLAADMIAAEDNGVLGAGATAAGGAAFGPEARGVGSSSGTGDAREELELARKREAAEAVFAALWKAQEAATAAAQASGELDSALKRAESFGRDDMLAGSNSNGARGAAAAAAVAAADADGMQDVRGRDTGTTKIVRNGAPAKSRSGYRA